jgi:hypothetical protein
LLLESSNGSSVEEGRGLCPAFGLLLRRHVALSSVATETVAADSGMFTGQLPQLPPENSDSIARLAKALAGSADVAHIGVSPAERWDRHLLREAAGALETVQLTLAPAAPMAPGHGRAAVPARLLLWPHSPLSGVLAIVSQRSLTVDREPAVTQAPPRPATVVGVGPQIPRRLHPGRHAGSGEQGMELLAGDGSPGRPAAAGADSVAATPPTALLESALRAYLYYTAPDAGPTGSGAAPAYGVWWQHDHASVCRLVLEPAAAALRGSLHADVPTASPSAASSPSSAATSQRLARQLGLAAAHSVASLGAFPVLQLPGLSVPRHPGRRFRPADFSEELVSPAMTPAHSPMRWGHRHPASPTHGPSHSPRGPGSGATSCRQSIGAADSVSTHSTATSGAGATTSALVFGSPYRPRRPPRQRPRDTHQQPLALAGEGARGGRSAAPTEAAPVQSAPPRPTYAFAPPSAPAVAPLPSAGPFAMAPPPGWGWQPWANAAFSPFVWPVGHHHGCGGPAPSFARPADYAVDSNPALGVAGTGAATSTTAAAPVPRVATARTGADPALDAAVSKRLAAQVSAWSSQAAGLKQGLRKHMGWLHGLQLQMAAAAREDSRDEAEGGSVAHRVSPPAPPDSGAARRAVSGGASRSRSAGYSAPTGDRRAVVRFET